MGPFTVLTQTAPNTYLLDLPPAWRVVQDSRSSTWSACCPQATADALTTWAATAGLPRPSLARMVGPSTKWQSCPCSRPVRRAGAMGGQRCVGRHMRAAGQPDQLLGGYCCLRAGHRTLPSSPRPSHTGRRCHRPAPALPPVRLHHRRGAARGPGRTALGVDSALLVAQRRLAAGTVACTCPRGAFSHVVAYHWQTLVLRGTEDTLLDAALYCSLWVLLSPTPAAGVARALRPRLP
jgi:hypothetical protein